MDLRRSHVSSDSENNDETRNLDRATTVTFGSGVSERAAAAVWNSSWYQAHLDRQDEERARQSDFRSASTCLCSFATAVFVHQVVCAGVWTYLSVQDRQGLIATCREADGMMPSPYPGT